MGCRLFEQIFTWTSISLNNTIKNVQLLVPVGNHNPGEQFAFAKFDENDSMLFLSNDGVEWEHFTVCVSVECVNK